MKKIQAESRWRYDLQSFCLGRCSLLRHVRWPAGCRFWIDLVQPSSRHGSAEAGRITLWIVSLQRRHGGGRCITVQYGMVLIASAVHPGNAVKDQKITWGCFILPHPHVMFASQTRMSANCAQPCVTRQLDCPLSETCVAIWLDM